MCDADDFYNVTSLSLFDKYKYNMYMNNVLC